MNCNIIFDYISAHNGEYWYRCTTCGASDWFAYYEKPAITSQLSTCRKDDQEQLENYELQQRVFVEINSMSIKQLAQQIIAYRKRIAQLEALNKVNNT